MNWNKSTIVEWFVQSTHEGTYIIQQQTVAVMISVKWNLHNQIDPIIKFFSSLNDKEQHKLFDIAVKWKIQSNIIILQ